MLSGGYNNMMMARGSVGNAGFNTIEGSGYNGSGEMGNQPYGRGYSNNNSSGGGRSQLVMH